MGSQLEGQGKMPWDRVRADFPVLESKVHLASASRGPLPRRSAELMQRAFANRLEGSEELDDDLAEAPENCRILASRLLRCSSEEIALLFNTTHGVNAFASGIDWHRGDSVVLPEVEYPANVMPWLGRPGVDVVRVPSKAGEIDPGQLERRVTDRTRVVALSHIEFATGQLNDLRLASRIAHEHGALLFVDAAQSLGVVDIDVGKTGVDALASCGYKWLCGPSGTGLMYIREDIIPGINPAYVGFEGLAPESYRHEFDRLADPGWTAPLEYRLSPGANRLEFGEKSDILLLGLASSLEHLLAFGMERIEARSRYLAGELTGILDGKEVKLSTPSDPSRRAGIVTFMPRGCRQGNREVADLLRSQGVLVSARYGGLRASCHYFNSMDDIHLFLRRLEAIVGRGITAR